MKTHHWYRIQAKADEATADVYVFREIGQPWFGDSETTVTAEQFVKDLAALPAVVTKIRVHINSPGGDPFEATAIANALHEQRTSKGRSVEVIIEGLAASAATIISCAGSPVRITDNALMMIHDPWLFAIGNAADFRRTADELDKVRDVIIATYKWISPKSADELAAMMAATTWMNADEAIAAGFATEKVSTPSENEPSPTETALPEAVAARLRAPAAYRERIAALVERPAPRPTPANSVDVLRLCREADVLSLAEKLIVSGATDVQVRARVTQEAQTRATAAARAADIQALCGFSRLPMLADSYVRSAMSLKDVGHQLATIAALRDNVEIDAYLSPDAGTRSPHATALPSAAAIYKARRMSIEARS